MRKKNLNKIYDTIYISDNKKKLVQSYTIIIYTNFTNLFLNLLITNKY